MYAGAAWGRARKLASASQLPRVRQACQRAGMQAPQEARDTVPPSRGAPRTCLVEELAAAGAQDMGLAGLGGARRCGRRRRARAKHRGALSAAGHGSGRRGGRERAVGASPRATLVGKAMGAFARSSAPLRAAGGRPAARTTGGRCGRVSPQDRHPRQGAAAFGGRSPRASGAAAAPAASATRAQSASARIIAARCVTLHGVRSGARGVERPAGGSQRGLAVCRGTRVS